MDFLKKFKKMDIPSTPTAPKIGRMELPEVDSPLVAHAAYLVYDDEVESTRYPSPGSPLSHTPRRRTGSAVSRSATPQCAHRSSGPTSEVFAPTPKWVASRTLLDQDWASCPTPDPHLLKEKSRVLSAQSPPLRASSSRHYERTSDSPEDLKKKLRPSTPQHHHSPRAPPSSAKTVETPRPESAKRPIKGILKSAPPKSARSESTELHWQLLPYEPQRCKKKLYFDVAMSPDLIRDHTRLPPVALNPSDTDKWAATHGGGLTQMIIKCQYLPHWDIVVQNDQGIKCRDIFEAIHRNLTLRLTEYEKSSYVEEPRRKKVQAAFEKRCQDVPMLTHVARREGWLRADLLEGKRIFMGLTRPQDGGEFWLLNLGMPLSD